MDKYRIKYFCIFILLILMVYKVEGYIQEFPLLNKVIYIDPGHGGVDSGTMYKDIKEKAINLEISLLLREKLESKGAIIYMTREGDYDLAVPNAYLRKRSDLSQRARIINNSNCDLYLSIHLNASSSTSWQGAQVFYSDINHRNERLATIIQESFQKHLGTKRSIKEIYDLYMYRKINRPGVLLELGFISNPNERYKLRQPYYQEKIGDAITEGVINYFNK